MEPMFPKDMTHNAVGRMKLQALFEETARPTDEPIMSLRASRPNGLPSLRDLFIQLVVDDPTETTFAELVFGDIDHWNQLLAWKPLAPYLKKWRAITDAKRKAKAFQLMIAEIDTRGKSAFSAAKFLIDEPWKDKRKASVKKEVQETTKAGFAEVSDDFNRLKEAGLLQ